MAVYKPLLADAETKRKMLIICQLYGCVRLSLASL